MIIRVMEKCILVPEKIEKFIESKDIEGYSDEVRGLKRINGRDGKNTATTMENVYKRFEYNLFVEYGYIQDLLIFQACRKMMLEVYELALNHQSAIFEGME